jgi:hypothetical protein
MKVNLDNLTLEQTRQLSEFINEAHLLLNQIVEKSLSKNNSLTYLLSVHHSRDVHQNSLFKKILFFLYLKNNKSKIETITSKDRNFLNFIKEELGLKIVHSPRDYKTIIKNVLRPLSLLQTLYLQYSFGKKLPKRKLDISSVKSLVEVNVVHSMLLNNEFTDRYYSDFHNYLSNENAKQVYYLPQFLISRSSKNSFFNNIKSLSYTSLIIKEHFLKPIDYLLSLLDVFSLKANFKGIKIDQTNFETLLQNTFKENKYKYSNIISLLNYRFCQRASEKGLSPKVLIDWFENQSADKGLNLGFNTYFPDCIRKGYQCFSMDRDYNSHLSLIPSDIQSNTAPHSIYITGKSFEKDCLKFSQDLQVNIAPAFRFSYLTKFTQKDRKFISVFLPFDHQQSKYIVELIETCAAKHPELNFKIKVHPSLNNITINEALNLTITKEPTLEIFKNSSLVISANSSVCFESVLANIPVIIVAMPNEPFQNTIPSSIKNNWFICWNKKDLSNIILNTLSSESTQKESLNLSDFIESPNKENTTNFIMEK